MSELVQFWLFVAFVALLLLLRFDAHRFGVAEYDDEERNRGWRGWIRRLSFYALGIGLVLLIFRFYPQPISILRLDVGADRQEALLLGLLFGLGGTVVAFGFAWFRYRRFRLPSARAYPGAIVNSIGTAFLDEAIFRGIILGLLLSWGWPPVLAIAFETILYGLATRLGAPGRSRAMLLISLGIGAVGGLLVVETLGIGAAVLGHAITRFAIFLATGHAGSVRAPGWEPEELAAWSLPPRGWDIVAEADAGTPTAGGPTSLAPGFAPGPGERLGPGARPGGQPPGAWPAHDPYAPASPGPAYPGGYPAYPDAGAGYPSAPAGYPPAPDQGWAPPDQGYPPAPDQGWAPPDQGYPPAPDQGWAPPDQGYPPAPDQGWAPPDQGYPPAPDQGWAPPDQGYPPAPDQGWAPPDQGYPPDGSAMPWARPAPGSEDLPHDADDRASGEPRR